MSNEKRKFATLDENIKSKVFTASDQYVKSYATDEIVLDVKINNKRTSPVKLKVAIYVSDLKNDLISIPQIIKNGYKVIFDGNRAVKRNDRKTVMVAEKRNELYIVNISEDIEHKLIQLPVIKRKRGVYHLCKRKIDQLPYKSSEHRQKGKLRLIHSNICFNEHAIPWRRKIFCDIYRWLFALYRNNDATTTNILKAFKKFKKRVEKKPDIP